MAHTYAPVLADIANKVGAIQRPGWDTRGRDDMSPIGIVVHHTASLSHNLDAPSVRICEDGRPGVPGPLCNWLISRSGAIYLIAAGTSNDTGVSMSERWDMMRFGQAPAGNAPEQGRVTHNSWAWDIEYENDGVGEPYSPYQIEAGALLQAHLCLAFGISTNSIFHHREMTSRKIDMSYGGDVRAETQAKLVQLATPVIEQELENMAATYQAKGNPTIYFRDNDGAMTPFSDYASFLDTDNKVPGPVVTNQQHIDRLIAISDAL